MSHYDLCVHMRACSVVSDSAKPSTVARKAPLSIRLIHVDVMAEGNTIL